MTDLPTAVPAVSTAEPVAPVAEPVTVVDPVDAVDALASEGSTEPDDRPVVKVRGVEFHLVPEVPALTMLRLAAAADPKTPQAKQMAAIDHFLNKVVVQDEVDAFLALLEDSEPVIDFDELQKVLSDASEAIGKRPTQP